MNSKFHGVTEVTKSVEIDGKTITFETGKYAKQASGAVVVSCGDSRVLVTGVAGTEPSRFDFLPLTVDYQDRFGAFGKIPGGFLKREGRGNERETLTSRLIDRPIRPMFPKTFKNEVQVIATVMSYDKDCETDILALCGASAALWISDAPMTAPIAGVRIVKHKGTWKLFPTKEETKDAEIALIIAGTKTDISMVEGGGNEAQEDEILEAFDLAQAAIAKIVAVFEELGKECGKTKMVVEAPPELDKAAVAYIDKNGLKPLIKALAVRAKHERSAALKAARNEVIAKFVKGKDEADVARLTEDAKAAWSKLLRRHMRETVISTRKRLDGRAPDEVRPIWCETGVAPRAHGSAVFTRGETQGFVTLALGTDPDAQMLDYPEGKHDRHFMLTYNFPPYCTGEARMLRGPKRREIGHGALAHRALEPVLPSRDDFPYVMRLTSEILESNGSSSMATVCGGCLALMDAGVPIKAPVAGIAMGLIKEGDDFAVISDILGDEDALGDMDFKVTGTANGITAFQMDTKIDGVSREIMKAAMAQAREGRNHILGEMAKFLAAPRDEMSDFAPRITTIHIKTDKIRDIIGPGGKTIRGIQEACDVKVSVDDSGKVDIASSNGDNTDKALAMIREITQEAEIGALYMGVVKRIVDFGAFVEIFPGTDGLIHISHLAEERVESVRDILNEGDEVLVRVIDVDRSGKVRLSRKEALAGGGL